ncbi:MAG TPA: hypothetical protein VH880_02665 [Anaeromyxobacteraceae bacterium]|jgi:hypothetical protein
MATRTDLRALPLPQRLRAQAVKLADDVKRSDRFFRMRAAVVGTWVLLSLLTMWAACPSSGPSNSLGADVQLLRESLVGGQQLLVRNESSEIWTEVVLVLDDGWRYEHRTLRPLDQLVLAMTHFRKGDLPAPRDYKPRTLLVQCRQGRHLFDLGEKPR